MIIAKKIRLFPTKEQEEKMIESCNTARYIYNYTLAKQEQNYKDGNQFIKNTEIRKELTKLKKTEKFIWLNNVSNNVTKQAVKDAIWESRITSDHESAFAFMMQEAERMGLHKPTE